MSPWVLVGFAALVALAGASGGLVNTIMVINRSLLPEGTAEDAGVSTKTSNAGLYVMNIVLARSRRLSPGSHAVPTARCT
jgi:hypothetical protein